MVLGAGSVLALHGCSPATNGDQSPETEERELYRWDCIQSDGAGRRYYYPDGVLSSRLGIDVSEYNGAIDWNLVSQDGIQFAFIRVGWRGYTEGGIFADQRLAENLQGVRATGLPFGVYFFSSAINEEEAREEALFALELLGDTRPVLPIAYDQEEVSDPAGRANGLSREQYTANARSFCETIEAAGFTPLIYGNQHHLSHLKLEELKWEIWYAEYGVQKPTSRYDFSFWQYSDNASVAGIEGGVDMNMMFIADASEKAILT